MLGKMKSRDPETEPMTVIPVSSGDLDAAKVSWVATLCSDDHAQLGVPVPPLGPGVGI